MMVLLLANGCWSESDSRAAYSDDLEDTPAVEQMLESQELGKALAAAHLEALERSHPHIGVEHLLLGGIRELASFQAGQPGYPLTVRLSTCIDGFLTPSGPLLSELPLDREATHAIDSFSVGDQNEIGKSWVKHLLGLPQVRAFLARCDVTPDSINANLEA